MRQLLVSDLKRESFADMYAQTLVYGLFVARYNDDSPKDFSRIEARELVPATNPFLREFFDHIAGPNFNKGLSYIVDELCDIFAVSDIKDIVHRHLRITEDAKDEAKDPIIHFYEDFLAAYDAELRKKMGAYYTPIPVARYIISMVDKVLKEDFGISDGIASNEKVKYTHNVDPYSKGSGKKMYYERTDIIPKVQILDPAVGTATFLNETVRYIYDNNFKNNAGAWSSYVNENILPRLNGFELMMTPYTIAHLKLGMTLSELGAKNLNDRLRIFLTNTLTEGEEKELPLFAFGLQKVVTEESNYASEVKNGLPVMVVIGNPPYSGESMNKNKYALSLIDKYKVEPGAQQKLSERNPKWLNDDYVKFISFAEDMISKNGKGVVAMITNHGYLDNPTFRGMRWHLTKTFDKIYILDLHGNVRKKEKAPDGGADENVFDTIQQGVSIIVAVKTSNSSSDAKVLYASEFGTRKKKYDLLSDDKIKYKKIKLDERMYYFVSKNQEGKEEYENGIALNELMPLNSVGVVTGKDDILINEDPDELLRNVEQFKLNGSGKVAERLKNTTIDPKKIEEISYRPFDKRNIYYDPDVIERSRKDVMKHLLREGESWSNWGIIVSRTYPYENWASIFVVDSISEFGLGGSYPGNGFIVAPLYRASITACRQQKTNDGFHHTLAAEGITESSYVSNKTSEITSQFPLFRKEGSSSYVANFDESKLKELFSEVEEPSGTTKVYPEDIFDYIYGSLHSPSYREKYKEFLKTDFPRISRPKCWKDFWSIAKLGEALRELHLMHGNIKPTATFPENGSNIITKFTYNDGKVWINDSQYFDNVSELAWSFYIGGYQPAQKWIKDRKGRTLTFDDINHYGKIITVLNETDRIMKEIG